MIKYSLLALLFTMLPLFSMDLFNKFKHSKPAVTTHTQDRASFPSLGEALNTCSVLLKKPAAKDFADLKKIAPELIHTLEKEQKDIKCFLKFYLDEQDQYKKNYIQMFVLYGKIVYYAPKIDNEGCLLKVEDAILQAGKLELQQEPNNKRLERRASASKLHDFSRETDLLFSEILTIKKSCEKKLHNAGKTWSLDFPEQFAQAAKNKIYVDEAMSPQLSRRMQALSLENKDSKFRGSGELKEFLNIKKP